MSDMFRTSGEAERAARNFELTTKMAEGFEVVATGKQNVRGQWDSEKHCSVYELDDMYDLGLDLSGNRPDRIGKVKVELPGFEIELGFGWFHAKTDYGWSTYVEYDAPKRRKSVVLKEDE